MLIKEENIDTSKRPSDGAFYQQRLPAWKPVINIHTTIPVFSVIGVFLVPIGLLLITTAGSVKEFRMDYSSCEGQDRDPCFDKPYSDSCVCEEEFTLDSKYSGKQLIMYYGLEKYYQNHRKYATSRSDQQLRGYPRYQDDNCEPYQIDPNTSLPYAPCGLIANTMFNDTFELRMVKRKYKNGTEEEVDMKINYTRAGIAWPSDHGTKFRNPPGDDLLLAFNGTTKPTNWRVAPFMLDETNKGNNAFLNEPFIVWMRVAAFPTFRKVYSYIDMRLNEELDNGLEAGTYKLTIHYNYPVLYYNSRKYFVLSTTSIFGGRNLMIGIVYLITGALLLLLAITFTCVVKKDLQTILSNFGNSN